VPFDEELDLLGFQLSQTRRDGTRQFALERNRFLTYWLHVPADAGPALFTWEFAIGEYMADYGFQLGASEPLNQFLFPRDDLDVPQDAAAVVKAMDRAEATFSGMDFGAQGI
jgi:hypothetical protein